MAAKNKGGRPTKFNKEVKRQCKLLAKAGWTDAQIAELLGITEQTLNNWKIKNPEFFESLKDWKAEADHKVERSLYQRACGYSFPDLTIQKEVDGKEVTEIRTKHQPPDPTSMIFWLKNRQPKKWRDKTEHGFTDKDGKDLNWTVEIVDPKGKNG
jgi:transcriptional regulator with XRE-family HTH domain